MRSLLAIARHGETDSNAKKLWVSETDYPLNERGILQARQLAYELQGYNFDLILSSNMLRAVQTAEIISSILGIPIAGKFDLFKDRNYGIVEGLTSDEIFKKYGIVMKNALTKELEVLEGVEKLNDLKDRVYKGILMILNKYRDKKVILISHGGFVRMSYRLFNGNDKGIYFYNCSYYILECEFSGCKVMKDITHISHLDSS